MGNGNEVSTDLVIDVHNKEFRTADGTIQALRDVDLVVQRGEILVILGPSGCGKTTLLRIVAGLDTDYAGEVSCRGRRVEGPGPDRGIMFQDPRLLPWLSVIRNIEFGLAPEGRTREKSGHARAHELLTLVGLGGFANSWPSQLSGGMAHRAALARALVNIPKVLLLDEPFAAVDMHTRFRLQMELARILTSTGTTALLVTHDIDEALYLGDRIAVMSSRPGTIVSVHPIRIPRIRDRSDPALLHLRGSLLQEMTA
jgi:sulfonate transport system ATP-binding protein